MMIKTHLKWPHSVAKKYNSFPGLNFLVDFTGYVVLFIIPPFVPQNSCLACSMFFIFRSVGIYHHDDAPVCRQYLAIAVEANAHQI